MEQSQRLMIDWWMHLRTQLPDDPLAVARQCNWGKDQLAKVKEITSQQDQAIEENDRPALYDNGIGDEYQHNLGIRKGHIGT